MFTKDMIERTGKNTHRKENKVPEKLPQRYQFEDISQD
jgi:hypothetical protein